MAGGQERILRGRIRSVQATKKITRAMELIAASRIVKAQQNVVTAAPYANEITDVARELAAAGSELSLPLLAGRPEVREKAFVVITADRGLCGGYNASVLRAAEGEIKADVLAGRDYEIIAVGRKAESYFRFRGYKIAHTFSGFSDSPAYSDARAIGNVAVEMFDSGEVDAVEMVYTRFVSAGYQEVVQRPLAPLGVDVVEAGDESRAVAGFEIEPDPTTVLDLLLPRYVGARVYAALLNAAASEHAARQRAMKAATDNAEELVKNLTRTMNRARQDTITTEIMEIVGGAEALAGDKHQASPRVELLEASLAGAPVDPTTHGD